MTDISKLSAKADFSAGKWIDEINDNPGIKVRVRSSRYKPYKNAIELASRRAGQGTISSVLLGQLLAEHILIDWDVTEGAGTMALKDGGKPVKYSAELALAVLTAEDDFGIGDAFRLGVIQSANKVADELAQQTEAAAGN